MTDLQAAAAILLCLSLALGTFIGMMKYRDHRDHKQKMRAYREAADRAERPSSFTASGGP